MLMENIGIFGIKLKLTLLAMQWYSTNFAKILFHLVLLDRLHRMLLDRYGTEGSRITQVASPYGFITEARVMRALTICTYISLKNSGPFKHNCYIIDRHCHLKGIQHNLRIQHLVAKNETT